MVMLSVGDILLLTLTSAETEREIDQMNGRLLSALEERRNT